MNIEIPKEIKYLEPFIFYLEKLDSNEIDDSVDTSKLIDGINERINKLSLSKSLSTLNNDMCILNEWIDNQSNPHPAVFITSFVQVNKKFIEFIGQQQIKKKNKHSRQEKHMKFTANPPVGFEIDKHKNAITFYKIVNQKIQSNINLQLITKEIKKTLKSIEPIVEKTTVMFDDLETIHFNLGGRENYLFTKNNTDFLLTVESVNPSTNSTAISEIINSLVISN